MIKKAQISSTETEKIFKEKMRAIEIQGKEKVVQRQAKNLRLDYIDLKKIFINLEALALVSKEQSKKAKAICFLRLDKEIRIGVLDPENSDLKKLIKNLKEQKDYNARIYLVSEQSFKQTFKLYEKIPKIRKIIKGVEIKKEELEDFKKKIKTFKDLHKEVQRCSVTDFMSLLIAAALKFRASDIHIEAEEEFIKIRIRIDGVLHQAALVAKKSWPQIISRIKLISRLKLNIVNKPQDGRFTIFLIKGELEVRVSTIPSNYGESVVIRLFSRSAKALDFEELGLTGMPYEQLKEQMNRPNGLIIVTGPTGSGKTTTLYAILNKLNKPDIKIVTLEDPIEYKLEGKTQSEVDKSGNYNFASGLKSILRQDPNIIMIGEIRDFETVEISLQAALTGHLVFSTLHTMNATGAIPRLINLGSKPFPIASALNTVIAQRLVRRLCSKCRKEVILDKRTMEKIENILNSIPKSQIKNFKINPRKLKFYQAKGCKECHNLGYKGRIGIFEIFIIDQETKKTILKSEISEYKVREIAIANGMITMAQDGLLKALEGITSVEEVFRVVE